MADKIGLIFVGDNTYLTSETTCQFICPPDTGHDSNGSSAIYLDQSTGQPTEDSSVCYPPRRAAYEWYRELSDCELHVYQYGVLVRMLSDQFDS